MERKSRHWTIRELIERNEEIEFPVYQREATTWDLTKKRKLVDSILRNFDIASIYLYKKEDGFDCVDGRQRINAIWSFVGTNEAGDNNSFQFVSSDELLNTHALKEFDGKRWTELSKPQQKVFLDYEMNVVEMTMADDEKDEIMNLLFLRLQLGMPLNAGEKLNAMVGDMRNYVFTELSNSSFFDLLKVPKHRFFKQLTAAQIALNFFSLENEGAFKRARFEDLQEFFKSEVKFSEGDKKLTSKLVKRVSRVHAYLKDKSGLVLSNRAIGVSLFFFLNGVMESKPEKAWDDTIEEFLKFFEKFWKTLRWQVKKGIDIDDEYRELLKFQNYVSQAAVESYAITYRQQILEEYFKYYLENKQAIKGEVEYKKSVKDNKVKEDLPNFLT